MEVWQEVEKELETFELIYKEPNVHSRCVAANAILLRFDRAIATVGRKFRYSSPYKTIEAALFEYKIGHTDTDQTIRNLRQMKIGAEIVLRRRGYDPGCKVGEQEIEHYLQMMEEEDKLFSQQMRLQPAEETQ